MTDPTSPPQPCNVCRTGCRCNPAHGEACDHYGCRGRPSGAFAACPGAVLEVARYEVARHAEDVRNRIFRQRRMEQSHTYARNMARQVNAARGEVTAAITEQARHVEP